ncbi:rho family protein [Pelomyxa schiedti]|nr:rho family protein [Pelomyxa schiedti]
MAFVRETKIVVIGDDDAGKTVLLIAFTEHKFPVEYVPTVFENYNSSVVVDGSPRLVSLWDTAGQEDYDRLRPLSYPDTDAFLLVFSVASRTSFEHIRTKWWPEVVRYDSLAKYIIVGTMTDLRDTKPEADVVSREEGEQLAKHLMALCYMECSSLLMQGVQEVFMEALRRTLPVPKSVLETSAPESTSRKKKHIVPDLLKTFKAFQEKKSPSSRRAEPPTLTLPPRPRAPSCINLLATTTEKSLPLTKMRAQSSPFTFEEIGCWIFNVTSGDEIISSNWGEPVDYVIINVIARQSACILTLTGRITISSFEVDERSIIAAGDSCRYFIICEKIGLGFETQDLAQNFLLLVMSRIYQANHFHGNVQLPTSPTPVLTPPIPPISKLAAVSPTPPLSTVTQTPSAVTQSAPLVTIPQACPAVTQSAPLVTVPQPLPPSSKPSPAKSKTCTHFRASLKNKEGETTVKLAVTPAGLAVSANSTEKVFPWHPTIDTYLVNDSSLKITIGPETVFLVGGGEVKGILDAVEENLTGFSFSFPFRKLARKYEDSFVNTKRCAVHHRTLSGKFKNLEAFAQSLDTKKREHARLREYDAAEKVKQEQILLEKQLGEISGVKNSLEVKLTEQKTQLKELWQEIIGLKDKTYSSLVGLRAEEDRCCQNEDYQQAKVFLEAWQKTEEQYQIMEEVFTTLKSPDLAEVD